MIAAPPSNPPPKREPIAASARIPSASIPGRIGRRNWISDFGIRIWNLPLSIWRPLSLISGIFTLITAAIMMLMHQHSVAEDPLGARDVQALREKLHTSPKDETLKAQIRALDLRERQRYFARVQRNTWGAWLLAVGGSVFIISATRCVRRPRFPIPRALASPATVEREAMAARYAVLGTAAVVVAGLAALGVTRAVRISAPVAASAGSTAASQPTFPSAADYSRNWPRFRGMDGSGFSAFTNIPIAWNIETGANIAWKTAVPLGGFNSPVIWGNRLFITGSSATEREIFCFDTANGALLWRLPVNLITAEAVAALDIPSLSGSTSATTAADDKRVFAMFATGELVAADHGGRMVWSKNFGKLENMYGHATSLVIWRDRLILQLDQGDAEAGKSRLYAFDVATGNVVWQQRRALPSSWATPIVASVPGGDQIICLGEPWLISYNAADGKELWKYNGFGDDLTPSPIYAAGLVFAISPNQKILALRPDGQGDITKTHVAWSTESNVPDIASPASNGELLFVVETSGGVSCLETKTGKKLWEHTYDTELQSSPAIAGEQLYVISTQGDAYVLKAGKEFREMAHNKFGEPVRSSPAFAEDRMFVRGETNLFCIGGKP